MEETYESIQKERNEVRRVFDERISKLQTECKHEKVTGWLLGYKGFGKLCKRCNKMVEWKDEA